MTNEKTSLDTWKCLRMLNTGWEHINTLVEREKEKDTQTHTHTRPHT